LAPFFSLVICSSAVSILLFRYLFWLFYT
jgi:hypothetical protein